MFEIRQCTQAECRLRFPLDPAVHRGAYCPRCGAALAQVGAAYQHHAPAVGVQPKRKFSLLLDNVRSAHNTGAILRTADGLGVAHVYLCGITPNPAENAAIHKTALGAERSTPWSVHPDAVALGQELKREGYSLLALETAPQSRLIFEVEVGKFNAEPLVLIVGNEQAGVDPGLLALCELVLSLPMVGSKHSLNVAVACGVAAYWLAFV